MHIVNNSNRLRRSDPKTIRNDILFVGYQANGIPGRDILRYAHKPGGYVFLDGHKKSIKANIEQLSGYSAHADQKGLLDWVQSMGDMPEEIHLVHGEYTAKQSLDTCRGQTPLLSEGR